MSNSTNFFSLIDPILDGLNIEFSLKKENGIIQLVFYSNPVIKTEKFIIPISIKAEAKMLDIGFFLKFEKVLSDTAKKVIDLKVIEDSMNEALNASNVMKTQKEQNKKFIDLKSKNFFKAKELITDKKYRQAITFLDKVILHDPKNKEAHQLKDQCKSKTLEETGDMFFQKKSSQTVNP